MHPEIEKLIDLAFKDGQITDKERDIILRKSDTLGLDKDEIEMILEGRISDQNKIRETSKTKQGVIKKCPHCGAPAKSFSDKCMCGEDFRFNTLGNLTDNLTDDDLSNAKKISRQSIPINKEELIEFATYSFGNANNNALGLPERNAWYSKFNEAKNKLKLSYQIEFNPFKSDSNIPFMGGLLDRIQRSLLEEKLSGQDLINKAYLEKYHQDHKKFGRWLLLLLLIALMCVVFKIKTK